jgi:hypothetical protein
MGAPKSFDPNVLYKRKSSCLRKGAPWLKTILVQCTPACAGISLGSHAQE